jgi:GDP-mannose transporter
MAPMTKAETAAANEDSNGAATELWRNTRVLGIILVYCAIGSQLSVVNKVVVTFIPLPNFILLAQFTATTLMLLAAHYTSSIEVEPLTWQIAGIFSPLVLTFFALLYAGMEVMKYAPLETFITVKSMTPVLFSACEYLFLGRALPNLKSTAALVGIVLGAATYVKVDAYASYHAYAFCALFLIAAVS